jgi:hypothetical protein
LTYPVPLGRSGLILLSGGEGNGEVLWQRRWPAACLQLPSHRAGEEELERWHQGRKEQGKSSAQLCGSEESEGEKER